MAKYTFNDKELDVDRLIQNLNANLDSYIEHSGFSTNESDLFKKSYNHILGLLKNNTNGITGTTSGSFTGISDSGNNDHYYNDKGETINTNEYNSKSNNIFRRDKKKNYKAFESDRYVLDLVKKVSQAMYDSDIKKDNDKKKEAEELALKEKKAAEELALKERTYDKSKHDINTYFQELWDKDKGDYNWKVWNGLTNEKKLNQIIDTVKNYGNTIRGLDNFEGKDNLLKSLEGIIGTYDDKNNTWRGNENFKYENNWNNVLSILQSAGLGNLGTRLLSGETKSGSLFGTTDTSTADTSTADTSTATTTGTTLNQEIIDWYNSLSGTETFNNRQIKGGQDNDTILWMNAHNNLTFDQILKDNMHHAWNGHNLYLGVFNNILSKNLSQLTPVRYNGKTYYIVPNSFNDGRYGSKYAGQTLLYNDDDHYITSAKLDYTNFKNSDLENFYTGRMRAAVASKQFGGILTGKYSDTDEYKKWLSAEEAKLALQQLQELQKLEEIAKSGKTKEQYEASLRKLKDGLTGTDYARITAIGADLGSMIAAYVPGYGTLASAGLGIGSTLTTLGADIAEDGFLWSDLGNAGVGIGADLIGLIPGAGSTSKIAKISKTLLKYVPVIIQTSSALGNSGEIKKSFDKLIHNPSDLTVSDLLNMYQGIAALTTGTQIGTAKFKEHKYKKATDTGNTIVKTNEGDIPLTKEQFEKFEKAKTPEDKKAVLRESIETNNNLKNTHNNNLLKTEVDVDKVELSKKTLWWEKPTYKTGHLYDAARILSKKQKADLENATTDKEKNKLKQQFAKDNSQEVAYSRWSNAGIATHPYTTSPTKTNLLSETFGKIRSNTIDKVRKWGDVETIDFSNKFDGKSKKTTQLKQTQQQTQQQLLLQQQLGTTLTPKEIRTKENQLLRNQIESKNLDANGIKILRQRLEEFGYQLHEISNYINNLTTKLNKKTLNSKTLDKIKNTNFDSESDIDDFILSISKLRKGGIIKALVGGVMTSTTRDNENNNENNNDTPKLNKFEINPELIMGGIETIGALITNNKIAKDAKDAIKPLLVDSPDIPLQPVMGNYDILLKAEDDYANNLRINNTPITSDANLQKATTLELSNQGLEKIKTARLLYNQSVNDAIAKNHAQESENILRRNQVALQNKLNMSTAAQLKAQIDLARDSKNWESVISPFLKLVGKSWSDKIASTKSMRDNFAQKEIDSKVTYDPNNHGAKYGIKLGSNELSVWNKVLNGTNYTDLTDAEKGFYVTAQRKVAQVKTNLLRDHYGINETLSSNDNKPKEFNVSLVGKGKNGTKLEVAKIRAKIKDAELFLKSMLKQLDRNEKALDRLYKQMGNYLKLPK